MITIGGAFSGESDFRDWVQERYAEWLSAVKRPGCNAAACSLPATGGEGAALEEDCCIL